jgi:hypothetical protein
MHQGGFITRIYRDARSTKHKILTVYWTCNCDVKKLYTSSHTREAQFCFQWQGLIKLKKKITFSDVSQIMADERTQVHTTQLVAVKYPKNHLTACVRVTHPSHFQCPTTKGVLLQLHWVLTSILEVRAFSDLRPGQFISWHTLYSRMVWPQGRSGRLREEKISCLCRDSNNDS